MSLRRSISFIATLMALCVCLGYCEQTGARDTSSEEQISLANSQANDVRSRHNSRLLAVPYSLARFLAYNARGGNPAVFSTGDSAESGSRQLGGYKRSSSSLDALTGVTLGKRSTNPMEFVNFEPVFGRQAYARGPPRVYDMRWAPLDSIEAPIGLTQADYN